MSTADRINADRAERGLSSPAGARRILIHLAIEAGYDFTQIAEQLRSGRGDERLHPDSRLAPITGPEVPA